MNMNMTIWSSSYGIISYKFLIENVIVWFFVGEEYLPITFIIS